MNNITLFSQILQQINRNLFHKAVDKYQTDKHSKGINSWTHLTAMLFCHLSKAQSIREITNGLLSVSVNLNHLGIQGKCPSRSSRLARRIGINEISVAKSRKDKLSPVGTAHV